MAKKPNFGFEKRQKDLKKQQKREEKAEKRRLRKEGGAEMGDGVQADGSSEPLPDTDTDTPHLMDEALRARVADLCAEGWQIWQQFDIDVRERRFHPFVAADYDGVLAALLPHRAPGRRFLEWGSASGVITIMADLLGFDACGIELDESLVRVARALAARFDSGARFSAGSFVPAGYTWRPASGDGRIATIGDGASGYRALGTPLDDYDIVFGFPWGGEEPMMRDLMQCYGKPGALLLLNTVNDGVEEYRNPPG